MNSEDTGQSPAPAGRWDRKYAAGEGPSHFRPNPLLVQHLHLLRGGRALDVACGFGGSLLLLAENGYYVDAVDASGVALGNAQAEARRRGLTVSFVQAELERWWFAPRRYDLIATFHYLNRDLTSQLVASLRPGGLWFEAQHNDRLLAVRPGFNRSYLVRPGELARSARQAGLKVLLHVDGSEEDPAVSQLVAKKPAGR